MCISINLLIYIINLTMLKKLFLLFILLITPIITFASNAVLEDLESEVDALTITVRENEWRVTFKVDKEKEEILKEKQFKLESIVDWHTIHEIVYPNFFYVYPLNEKVKIIDDKWTEITSFTLTEENKEQTIDLNQYVMKKKTLWDTIWFFSIITFLLWILYFVWHSVSEKEKELKTEINKESN